MDQIQFNTLDQYIGFYHRKLQNISITQFQESLQHLTILLSDKKIQIDAKNNCFFKRWSEIKIPLQFFTLDFISQIFVIYTKVNDALKEDILLDFFWPLIIYEFEEEHVIIEYFNIMKVIYNKNYKDQLKYFGILEIVKYMLKTTEFDNTICCEQHNNKEQQLQILNSNIYIKIEQFALLINEIIRLLINDIQQTQDNNLIELEQLFSRVIHQILSYCTKDHNPCQIKQLLLIILNALIQVNSDIIQKTFSNFEALSFIVLLYNSTTFQGLQVFCIRLFQVITNKNQSLLPQLILSLIPNNNNKDLIQQLCNETLLCSIIEWLLNYPIQQKITEYSMFDEKSTFKINEVFELILRYLYISPDMIKQYLITTIYTMIRNNKENQNFILQNKCFLSTFPKFLMSLQDIELLIQEQNNNNSISKSVYDTGLKILATLFYYQMQQGKIDILYQWLKLIQLELLKYKNQEIDCIKDQKTPIIFIRQIFIYIFNNILKSNIIINQELQNENLWKGFNLFIVTFLSGISSDLINQNYQQIQLLGKIKYSPQIFLYQLNIEWIDYQYLNKITQILTFLYSQTISMNLDIIQPSINFKTTEFVQWLNQLFKKILGGDKDNIFLFRILQHLICYYQHYIITINFGQEQLDEISQLLKSYRHLMQSLICGSQQLKNLKYIPIDLEYQIIQSHYFYIESQIKLINQIKQKCSKDYNIQNDLFFNQIEEKYTLQELKSFIQQQLQEYYISLIKLCQIYGKRTQIFIWNFCYELIRMKKMEGEILESYLQTLINQPDIINDIVCSDEMIIYYIDCPNIINIKQKSQLKLQELIKWYDLCLKQQENESITLYQEQYSRQSQILMKDVTQTLNKYNLIQLQNYEIFEQEKLRYDQSKTL